MNRNYRNNRHVPERKLNRQEYFKLRLKKWFENSRNVFAFMAFLRFILVFFVRTFYVPDEYWQSLEVAHKLVFGYVSKSYVDHF